MLANVRLGRSGAEESQRCLESRRQWLPRGKEHETGWNEYQGRGAIPDYHCIYIRARAFKNQIGDVVIASSGDWAKGSGGAA